MKGTLQTLKIDGQNFEVYMPAVRDNMAAIYVLGDMPWLHYVLGKIEAQMGKALRPCALISVPYGDWNDDFSPWPASAVHKDRPGFAGGAGAFLQNLTNNTLPLIRKELALSQEAQDTGIIGYSLAGLAALYALYCTQCFRLIGSLSGSLWYEGWIAYMQAHPVANAGAKVFLSLGKKEEKTRHPLFSTIGDCTRSAHEMLLAQLEEKNVHLLFNDGGHGTQVEQRFLAALNYLLC